MKIKKTNLSGVLLIEPEIFTDHRGFFLESYNKKKYQDFGICYDFVQDNISKSTRGTIRGLHYQVNPNSQGKLCFVLKGSVIDVAVDIRFNSPTFGHYYSIELSEEKMNQIWIPPGFAHGFSVLSEEVIFMYKCTNFYSKADERAILYNDPDLNIDWKVEDPVVSEKDLKAPLFRNIAPDFVFH